MSAAEFWIIAGPNGAGKTTLSQGQPIRQLIAGVRPLNPDDLTLAAVQRQGFRGFADVPPELLRDQFIRSAEAVLADAAARLRRNEVVAVETVLSTDKYRSVVQDVLERRGFFGMIYIALQSAELAQARVAQRVRLGGHGVAPERVAARWQRSLEQLPWFARLAHRLVVFDNSDSDENAPPLLVAEGNLGRIAIYQPNAIPRMAALQSATNPA